MMSNIDKEDVNDSYLCDQRQEKLNKMFSKFYVLCKPQQSNFLGIYNKFFWSSNARYPSRANFLVRNLIRNVR